MVVTVASGDFVRAIVITVLSSDSQATGKLNMILVWNNSVVDIMEPLCNILRHTYNYLYSLYDLLQNEDLSVYSF